MNTSILALIITAVFTAIKYAMQYKMVDVRATIQDTVVCFGSAFAGIYLYQNYYDAPSQPKVTAVFTEKPNF